MLDNRYIILIVYILKYSEKEVNNKIKNFIFKYTYLYIIYVNTEYFELSNIRMFIERLKKKLKV